ncbi:hypothetical protein PIB30_085177 [Stylosanthes scabra]|uniref:Uncharacterized protein n=1 Tax=Stylosanthes scabra TaxID=79078 RepID=A0ABU6YVJ1_9FABA|nr:hypothetical protein [Stylosanthes scabra]
MVRTQRLADLLVGGRVGAVNREQLTAMGLRLTAGRRSGEVAQWACASLSWLRCTDIQRSDEGRGPRQRSEKSCLRRGCEPRTLQRRVVFATTLTGTDQTVRVVKGLENWS